jgi:hypothetical protein
MRVPAVVYCSVHLQAVDANCGFERDGVGPFLPSARLHREQALLLYIQCLVVAESMELYTKLCCSDEYQNTSSEQLTMGAKFIHTENRQPSLVLKLQTQL